MEGTHRDASPRPENRDSLVVSTPSRRCSFDLGTKRNRPERRKSCTSPLPRSNSNSPLCLPLDGPATFLPRPKHHSLRNYELLASRSIYSSLNSDVSVSSVSSVESLLELRRENPEEILLALGFGGYEETDNLLRIPSRFFEQQSKARGINVGEIIHRKQRRSHKQRSVEKANRERHSSGNQIDLIGNAETPMAKEKSKPKKLLIMGPKLYHFDGSSESDLYSPQTSAVAEFSVGPSFVTLSPRSASRAASRSVSPNRRPSGNLLAVPYSGQAQRKLSCPHISTEDLSHTSTGKVSPSEPTNAPSTGNAEMRHLTPLLPLFINTESLDTLKPKLASILDNQSSEANLNLNYFIETALITSIQSLKLSLDFYRYFTLTSGDPPEKADQLPNMKSTSDYGSRELQLPEPVARLQAQTNLSNERNEQRLNLQNLYLEVLAVEKLLHDCLDRFKSSPDWPGFVSKYIGELQEAVDKISSIQESLGRLNASYSRSLSDFYASL